MFLLYYFTYLVALRTHCQQDSAATLLSAPIAKNTPVHIPISALYSQAASTDPFDSVKSPAVKIGQIQTATGGTIKQDSCYMA